MVTFVATVTGDVVIVKSAVKLFAGAVAVAGTLASDGLLLTSEICVTKASPQKIDRSPFQMVSNAPVVAGKSRERVWPVRYTWPGAARAMSSPTSVCDPPRKVE